MDKIKLKISLIQLENLLNKQKEIVCEKLLYSSGQYNTESNEGHYKTLPIDKEKFKKIGINSNYPEDFNILCKYLEKE